MKRMLWKWGIVAALAVALMTGYLIGQDQNSEPSTSEGGTFALVQPAFAQTATEKSFLESEAGISVYVNAGQAIDLAKAKPLFKVLEDETESYLIGTVELAEHGEDFWPHAYIDKDGWIVVYYPKEEPPSKLFQWIGYQRDVITTTTLRDILRSLVGKLGLDVPKVDGDIRYYHFQYPEATKLLIVVDTTEGSDSFRYTIPYGITVYDASASHRGAGITNRPGYGDRGWSKTTIDGTEYISAGTGTYTYTFNLKEEHRSLGNTHTVSVGCEWQGWVGIAILFLYR